MRNTSVELPIANKVAIATKNLNLQSNNPPLPPFSKGGLGGITEFSNERSLFFFFSLIKRIIKRTAIAPGIMESQKTVRKLFENIPKKKKASAGPTTAPIVSRDRWKLNALPKKALSEDSAIIASLGAVRSPFPNLSINREPIT